MSINIVRPRALETLRAVFARDEGKVERGPTRGPCASRRRWKEPKPEAATIRSFLWLTVEITIHYYAAVSPESAYTV